MKTLTEYFRFVLEETAPEAPANALFGQYLFSPTRDDTPDPKEKNTITRVVSVKIVTWNLETSSFLII
jgi:hypothetical protein